MFIYKQFKNLKDNSGKNQKSLASNLSANKFTIRRTRQIVKILAVLFIFLILIGTTPTHIIGETTNGQNAEELRAELKAQIEALSNEIDKYRGTVREIQGQATSLQGEIDILDNQIKAFELEIKRINLIIGGIESDIQEIELKIKNLEQQTESEKIVLSELIREIYKYDETSFLEIVLTKENLSDFFSEIQSLENLQLGIQKSLNQIRILKQELGLKIGELDEQRNEMIALRAVQETQKYSIEKKKGKRNELLEETRGQEYLYQRLINNKQADINSIRSQLYILQGMGGSLSFENALNLAEFAGAATGVRPALLMAVLSRESGLGKNVGTGTWKVDMNPNQHSAYLSICERLELDPDMMPVSKRAWYGWGGAMGPAQFLPRTWLGYESRITQVTGHNPPSPWDIGDAFVASALYLANAGAGAQTYDAEWKAAMIYLAGSNWWKRELWFYGDQVMDLAATMQEQINLIR